MLAAVEAVEAVLNEARKRIPDHMKDTAPYSINALWKFYARTHHDPPGESCTYCKMFDGQTFLGSDLRAMFPDHEWEGDDIYANVHMTLWGKSGTCACLLIREPAESVDLERMDLWQGVIGTDWTEQPKEEKEDE